MSELEILTVDEAAAKARRHPVTIRKALEAGDLHGYQRRARGRWSIEAPCLAQWVRGATCQHQQRLGIRGHLRAIGGAA